LRTTSDGDLLDGAAPFGEQALADTFGPSDRFRGASDLASSPSLEQMGGLCGFRGLTHLIGAFAPLRGACGFDLTGSPGFLIEGDMINVYQS
jgi:hypothetical protein